MKVAAVVPTCRGFVIPAQSIPVDWIMVHDRERWPVEGEAKHIVAPDPKRYGVRCDSIRSAGFLQAYRDGYDVILTVDDDCYIPPDWAESHVEALDGTVPVWSTTMKLRPRGLPYNVHVKPVALSHGLWDHVPDLDGITQDELGTVRVRHEGVWQPITPPFPQSAMNFGFVREVAAAMYQPAQGEGTPFDRFADIWAGVIGQRVLTLHGWAYKSGGAVVTHTRASNVKVNIDKERPGMEAHETFWRHVWDFYAKGPTLAETYGRLANHVSAYKPPREEWRDYFTTLRDNMWWWVDEVGC